MLSNIRAFLAHVNADNYLEMIVALKSWVLAIDSLQMYAKYNAHLDSPLTLLSLASKSMSLEVEALFQVMIDTWPRDFDTRMAWIAEDIAKTESVLKGIQVLAISLGDPKTFILAKSIERLLS